MNNSSKWIVECLTSYIDENNQRLKVWELYSTHSRKRYAEEKYVKQQIADPDNVYCVRKINP